MWFSRGTPVSPHLSIERDFKLNKKKIRICYNYLFFFWGGGGVRVDWNKKFGGRVGGGGGLGDGSG